MTEKNRKSHWCGSVDTLSIHCLRFFITVTKRLATIARRRKRDSTIGRADQSWKMIAARTCISGIGCWRNWVVPLQRKCYFALVVLGTTLRTWLLANIRQSLRASQVESVSLSRWSNQGRIYARISARISARLVARDTPLLRARCRREMRIIARESAPPIKIPDLLRCWRERSFVPSS